MRKQIVGFEGLYEVDEYGNVYSLRKGNILAPVKMKSGYYYVHLCNGKITKLARLHRVVANAFLPNPEKLAQVNHINGDKSDNRAENLEWCDNIYNMRHAVKTGLFNPVGENNPSSKLSLEDVEEIRKEYKYKAKGRNTKSLALKYGVSNVMIGKIVRGENWKVGFDKARSINREEAHDKN